MARPVITRARGVRAWKIATTAAKRPDLPAVSDADALDQVLTGHPPGSFRLRVTPNLRLHFRDVVFEGASHHLGAAIDAGTDVPRFIAMYPR